MGGLAIVGAALGGYVIGDMRPGTGGFQRSGLSLMALILGCAAVGFVDDYLGIRFQRNLGLNKRAKSAGQLAVAIGFTILCIHWVGISTRLSFARDLGVDLGGWGWAVWAVLIIIASANAVNLTDGLDGLASGSAAFVAAAFVIIAFWQGRHEAIYGVSSKEAIDVAVVAAAVLGACAGFLWWNAAPARIFMGDTGSLALGGGLAGLALLTRTQLLLPIMGGLFVLETLSVVIQVISFRGFKRRVFRMAPIHHHFELAGWPEFTVIVRFWLIAGLFVAFGLGLFYADFIRIPGALD